MKKTTLCENCVIEVFKKCPYSHGWGRVNNMKTLPVLIKQDGRYISQEMVVKCPQYIPETHRSSK